MPKIRRYDLDWLRVIVFALLIFYHVGMFFVPWGWHIKNETISRALIWPMLFVNQWRLPILFMISGMGTAYALSFRSGGQFIKERFIRLFIPLVFGMLVIVPPQIYIERLYNGEYQGSYLDWLSSLEMFNGIYPAGNFSWHHLWFLPYLLVFSILLTPLFLKIRKQNGGGFLQVLARFLQRSPLAIFYFVIPLFLYESLLEPFFNITHNLISDWFNFISSMTLFFYGYLFISIADTFWVLVAKIKKTTMLIGVICFSGLLVIWLFFEDSVVIHFIEATLKTVNLWAWILTLFGFASKYLNRSSKMLSYANQAVYPFYILHQTITIIIGFWLWNADVNITLKMLIMVLGTFLGSWLIYEFLIRRIKLLWPLFGLKIGLSNRQKN